MPVAGHLPQKQQDYRKRYRALASTYLTFSPDGTELLVNLGGEQIYLFNVNSTNRPPKFSLPVAHHTNGVVKGKKYFFLAQIFSRQTKPVELFSNVIN